MEKYVSLWNYAKELKLGNPRSTIDFKDTDVNEVLRFFKFYVYFVICKNGWLNRYRPIIGVDGCFLKMMHKGHLLCVVYKDGNNQIFPITWAVV